MTVIFSQKFFPIALVAFLGLSGLSLSVLKIRNNIKSRVIYCGIEKDNLKRYSRHLVLKDVGVKGQKKILSSSVLVIGCGGLGSLLLMNLAASGVKEIGIIDDDRVELSNLHRQIIHSTDSINKLKVDSAEEAIKRLNKTIKVNKYNFKIDNINVLKIINKYDLIVEVTDSLETKYLVNEACKKLEKNLIISSAQGIEGQFLCLFFSECNLNSCCYNCVFKYRSNVTKRANCSDNGVLGPVPSVISSLISVEVVKILSKTYDWSKSCNVLFLYDGSDSSFHKISLQKRNECKICSSENENEIEKNKKDNTKDERKNTLDVVNIKVKEYLKEYCIKSKNHILLDVRNETQRQICSLKSSIWCSLDQLKLNIDSLVSKYPKLNQNKTIIVYCRRGNDSKEACKLLKKHFEKYKILNLEGGLEEWCQTVEKSELLY